MRAAAVVLVAALAFVAAGCGGGGKQSFTPLELVSQAVSKTTTSKSAKFHMSITETVGPLGPLTMTADGATDNTNHTATMTMDLSAVAQLAGSQAGSPADWKASVILDGTTEYMQLPVLTKLVPGGKPWIKLDLDQLAKLKGVDFSQLLQVAGQQDPTQALQWLQSVGNVQKVGEEQVDGVDTTKYSGTLDPQKIAAKFAGAGLGTMLTQMGTTPIPVTVWVDGDGYVRKLDESLQAGPASVKLEATLSDFGTKVDVNPPPADQTTDLLQLLKPTK
jgi:hypothetical protein